MSRKKWSEYEIEIMKSSYHKGLRYMKLLLPNRSKSSLVKKAMKLNLKSDRIFRNLIEIERVVKESFSFSEVFRKLNKSKSGDGYHYLRRFIIKNNIDTSHFKSWKNNGKFRKKKDMQEYLVDGSNISSSSLKIKLYEHGLKQRICEKCGQDENWNGEKMSLILDHINGIPNDNRLENLRILCPNCNATLPTHCRGKKGLEEKKLIPEKEGFTESEKRSQLNQRRVERPSYEALLKETAEFGFVATGKKYGVSDNSIRKWIKMYQKHGADF